MGTLMVYNDTNLSIATNIYELAKASNEVSGGDWIFAVFGGTFFIAFALLDGRTSTGGAIVGASASTTLLGSTLWALNFMPIEYLGVPFAALFISFVFFLMLKD